MTAYRVSKSDPAAAQIVTVFGLALLSILATATQSHAQVTLTLSIDPANPTPQEAVTVEISVTGSVSGQGQCRVTATNGFAQTVTCQVGAKTNVGMGTFAAGSHSVTVQISHDGTVLDTKTARFDVGGGGGGALPDLTVSNPKLNKKRYETGELIQVTYTVRNRGGDPPSGTVRVNVSMNGTVLEVRDAEIGQSTTSAVPAPLEPGRYRVVVDVDPDDEVDENNDNNNDSDRSVQVKVAPQIDLSWHDVSVQQGVAPNDAFPWEGEFDINSYFDGSVTVEAFIDGTIVDARQLYIGFGAGRYAITGSVAEPVSNLGIYPLTLGTHNVTWVLDRFDQVAESNEGNNVFSEQIEVRQSGSFDLYPGKVSVKPRKNATVDDPVTVSFKVKNKGQAESRSVKCALEVDGELVASKSCKAGDKVSFDLPAGRISGLGSGDHRLTVLVDVEGRIAERRETNNERTATLSLFDPFAEVDLEIVSVVYHPDNTNTVEYCNHGQAPAPQFFFCRWNAGLGLGTPPPPESRQRPPGVLVRDVHYCRPHPGFLPGHHRRAPRSQRVERAEQRFHLPPEAAHGSARR